MRQDLSLPKRQQRPNAGMNRLFSRCLARLVPHALTALLIGFVCLGIPSHAGVYTVTYSGGSVSSTSGSTTAFSLQQAGWTGSASAGGYASASAQVNGTITATFTWQPDPSLPSDPPPSAAIVTEQCTAGGNGYAYTTCPTGTASDGFGDPSTIPQQGPTSITITCANYRSSAHYGASFTVTCSPSATMSGTMCSLYTSVSYMALATPVGLNLSGVTPNAGSNNILIGQGVTASVNTGNLQQTAWSWTISGDPFAGFQIGPGSSTGHAIELTDAAKTQATVPYFYRSIGNKGAQPPMDESSQAQTVTCTATITNLNPNLAPFPVTVSTTVNVFQPAHEFSAMTGTVQVRDKPSFGNGSVQLPGKWLIPYDTPQDYGITWTVSATTPALFAYPSTEYIFPNGSWCLAQIITVDHTTIPLVGLPSELFAGPGLDGQFPYHNVYPGDGTPEIDGDAPGGQLDSTKISSAYLNDAFNTFMLYMPPDSGTGTTWVPLHKMDWSIKAAAQYDAGLGAWVPSSAWVTPPFAWDGSYGTIQVIDSAPTSVLPDWIRLL